MNQQRQRRFRSAQAAQALREEALEKGEALDEDPFDSNCITPGTPFMERLSAHIQYFVRAKLRDDAKWRGLQVVFSGAESVGEGEHKIMGFMRARRMQPDYDPNLRHVFYGLDADLIMLSLLSHEHHIALLREEVVFGPPKQGVKRKTLVKPDEFQFLHLGVLRDYLRLEFQQVPVQGADGEPEAADLERVIDDWVCICFLVGNDFLPGLPTLDIADGGLNTLLEVYKGLLPAQGYVTHWGSVRLPQLLAVLAALGEHEQAAFARMAAEQAKWGVPGNDAAFAAPAAAFDLDAAAEVDLDALLEDEDEDDEAAAADLAWSVETGGDLDPANYYARKFPEYFPLRARTAPADAAARVRALCAEYVEGLLWCYKYYYAGVQSWRWHFTARFAPLASSFAALRPEDLRFDFSLGEPFRPMEQLMGVLPPGSATLLPAGLRPLMEAGSPVKDFYPDDFEVDMNGKRNPWEGIALIPFIEETRLVNAMRALPDALTPQEELRNRNAAVDLLFTHDPAVEDAYPLEAGFGTTAALLALGPGDPVGRSLAVAAAPPGYSAADCFPPLARCCSRVTAFRTPLVPRTPHFAGPADVAAMAELDALDAAQLNMHYGHAPQTGARLAGEGRYLPVRLPGARAPLPGFPSLFHLARPEAFLDRNRVNVFGRRSQRDSVILRVPDAALDAARIAAAHPPGSEVYTDFPYLRPALVVRIQDGDTVWTAAHPGGPVQQRAASGAEQAQYRAAVEQLQQRARETQGLEMSYPRVVAFVRPLTGMGVRPDGSAYRSYALPDFGNFARGAQANPNNYANDSADVRAAVVKVAACPAQLLFAAPAGGEDPRWTPRDPAAPAVRLPVGSEAVFVGPRHYGSVVRVTGHARGLVQAEVLATPLPLMDKFPQLVRDAQLAFYSGAQVAADLKLDPGVLGRITASLSVDPGRVDVGLNLKYSRHGLVVPDYARRGTAWAEGGAAPWEYSELAVAVLFEYQQRFPELFAFLAVHAADDRMNLTAAMGGQVQAVAYLARVREYLASLAVSHQVGLPCASRVASRPACALIEENMRRIVAKLRAARPDAQWLHPPREPVLVEAPAALLYRESSAPAWSPTSPQRPSAAGRAPAVLAGRVLAEEDLGAVYSHALGDRVLSLRSDEGARVGAEGTVVGVHGNFAEVLFDEPFPGGATLQGKCADPRGKLVSLVSLLNLSAPKPVAAADCELLAKHMAAQEAKVHRKPGNNNNKAQPKQQQQSKQPKQPLPKQQQPKQQARQTAPPQDPAIVAAARPAAQQPPQPPQPAPVRAKQPPAKPAKGQAKEQAKKPAPVADMETLLSELAIE
jgi:5'-3' exonuclease